MMKRGTPVRIVNLRGKIKNPLYELDANGRPVSDKPYGYRISDGKRPAFWFVVPAYAVEEDDE